jgi:hypothetical protein
MAEAGVGAVEPTILPVHNMIAKGAGSQPGTLVLIDVQGFGAEAYDAMVAAMPAHIADGSNHPAVSHVAAETSDGMLVADLWESPDAFGAFAVSQIEPAGAAAGLGQVQPRFVPVLNRLRGPQAR